jgi:DNA-directed RNA polymerase specialized sigma24 family protein
VPYGEEPWESDQELVAHILRGSIEHCDMLCEAYFPWVYRFALKRLQDPAQAEAATQEVFSIVFNALPGFNGSPSLRVGISRITRDAVNRRLAARKCGEPWTDDGELVTKILRGSTEHFDMLFEAYFPRVYRCAFRTNVNT